MFKRYLAYITAAAATVCSLLTFSMSAGATTVDDVAETARKYGYSEEYIRQGYERYYEDPDLYTSDDFDYAIQKLEEAGSQLVTTAPQDPNAYTTTSDTQVTTVPASEAPVTTSIAIVTNEAGSTVTSIVTQAPVKVNGGQGGSSGQNGGQSSSSGEITYKTSDGTTFTRMSRADFIKLSYADKMAYLRTFTPEQQQIIINDFSPEEYRQMLKQAPSTTKMDVVDELSKAADVMGMNITVNEISDDSVSIAMRNDKGELIGVATAGNRVEDTGYDRRGIYAVAALIVTAAGAGMIILKKKCFGKDTIGD
ncbi:hypothetical protein [uncultured Ruminococcus sp.]|uniref:hypothetical protein n=1 Tax=uncultured Ruminococcus sp. TaxID=165186 RepID=UPI002601CB80|nr:hypothetical protein [uncultured Ruminococcus sp.]